MNFEVTRCLDCPLFSAGDPLCMVTGEFRFGMDIDKALEGAPAPHGCPLREGRVTITLKEPD